MLMKIGQILEVLETIGLDLVISGENVCLKILLLGQGHQQSFHMRPMLQTIKRYSLQHILLDFQ